MEEARPANSIRIEGERIVLRDLTFDELPVLEYWLNPTHDHYKTDAPSSPLPSPEEIAAEAETRRKNFFDHTPDSSATAKRTLFIIDRASNALLAGAG